MGGLREEAEVDIESFEVLEQEIERAITLIEELKEEKSQRERENAELRAKLSEMEGTVSALREENERLKKLMEERRERLKARLEQMLSKLESPLPGP